MPQQRVLDAPCGHRLRYYVTAKDKFICPINDKVYSFKRKIYSTIHEATDGHDLYPAEAFIHMAGAYDCKLCQRSWYYATENTGMSFKFVCFCYTISNKYPCGICPARLCSKDGCMQVVDGMSSLVCERHYV